jgi:hypothetical protein
MEPEKKKTKKWIKPRLTIYGDVEKITQGNANGKVSGAFDANLACPRGQAMLGACS